MDNADQLLRFSFGQLDIRGELVYLDDSWQQVLARHDYPHGVRRQLGEALAAAALLSVTIKFDGTLIVQIQGQGPLRSLVAQMTSKGALRGLARWDGLVPEGDLHSVFGDGTMLITIMKAGGERYQSIVSLEGQALSDALAVYFRQSEQLPSSFRLFVTGERVAGLFLQQLPPADANSGRDSLSHDEREEHWQRINLLASTVKADELLALPAATLLHRLFHEEQVHLLGSAPVHFACTCSRSKVTNTLASFGKQELQDILAQEGSIKVDCEFCNEQYLFDAVDVEALFEPGTDSADGVVLH